MKICTNAKCKHSNNTQPIRNFSQRSGKDAYKKDGTTPQYLSQCKSCQVTAQTKRVTKKRAEARVKKLEVANKKTEFLKIKAQRKPRKVREDRHCVDCETIVSANAMRCGACNSAYQSVFGMDKTQGRINPRFIEPRGSRQRKKLGLEPLDFSLSRGYGLELGA